MMPGPSAPYGGADIFQRALWRRGGPVILLRIIQWLVPLLGTLSVVVRSRTGAA